MTKLALVIVLVLLSGFAVLGQSENQSMYIGDVQLRLGMPEDAAMKLLTNGKYTVTATGPGSFFVQQYDPTKKIHNVLGSVTFDAGRVKYLSRNIDTSSWPDDEGYAVGRAIYDAIGSSITRTDSDGAKRASATIVVESKDIARPTPGTLRTIHIYINGQNISVLIWDGPEGRGVSASVAISTRPW